MRKEVNSLTAKVVTSQEKDEEFRDIHEDQRIYHDIVHVDQVVESHI